MRLILFWLLVSMVLSPLLGRLLAGRQPARVTVPCRVDGAASDTWGEPGFQMTINGRRVTCP